MAVSPEFWNGKRVFLTGHTGFKGGWLVLWLSRMGAIVYGYALSPSTKPNLYDVAKLSKLMAGSFIADIRDADRLAAAIKDARPDIVFHLAAQPLVRYSYREPAETYAVNVMGTVNLLEAVRHMSGVKAVVNVTTDKCYENREREEPYQEQEALGGYDPYSSSKACSELVTSSYRRSFMQDCGIGLASARAGNVIGGGDWSEDRLVPDFLRAIDAGDSLTIRYPQAVRPWQHVLEPLSGYLMLAERLYGSESGFDNAWNFGPEDRDARSVGWIADYLCSCLPGVTWRAETAQHFHEAGLLHLCIDKAREKLGWYPRWQLEHALKQTIDWHLAWRAGQDMKQVSLQQIASYEAMMVVK